jgi:hypothetical protein
MPEIGQKTTDHIFTLLKENKLNEALDYVEQGKLNPIDCVDEHGTTPLQYAAFRGFDKLCSLLIKKGADVNAKTHDQGYSALMFAAISNHTKVVNLLLEHGSNVDYKNNIDRTASQMAAFVNSNESVDLINGFIPKRALEYYTETHSSSETEPKLPKGDCLNELHKLLINTSNYSPLRIIKCIKLSKNNVLMSNIDRIIRTLDAFVTKSFKNNKEEHCPNDILSFKLHYHKFIFEYLNEQKKNLAKIMKEKSSELNEEQLQSKLIDLCLKNFISEEEVSYVNPHGGGTVKKMCRLYEEKFTREAMRQFPYKECALLRQMVTILAKTQIGAHPSAQYVLKSCLNGQKLNEELGGDNAKNENRTMLECATCLTKSFDAKWCTHCKKVAYCDQFCQKVQWSIHKNVKV